MRSTSTVKALCCIVVIVILTALVPQGVFASGSSPKLTNYTVTPRRGRPEIEYLFTVKYTDSDNDPPVVMKVFIDQVGYDMWEVDPSDTNYTDGKDYFYNIVLSQGSYTFYYMADDGMGNEVTTSTLTLEVTWDVGHYDLIHFFEEEIYPGILMIMTLFVVIILILCFVMAVMALQMRKIGKALEKRSEAGESEEEPKD